MIYFPILDSLKILNYGLFPGTPQHPGLNLRFHDGITLILGTNGLGKSTLVNVIYRMLSGPFDIPGLATSANLGNMNTNPRPLSAPARRTFGNRVMNGANNATARLTFRLGHNEIVVERRLNDLSITHFEVNGNDLGKDEKKIFQPNMTSLVGVPSFGDWILLLRHLTFYFENRRALVWDPAAQRQILRLLLLPHRTAEQWIRREREILELDTRMRNLSAALYQEEQSFSENEVKGKSGKGTRRELEALEKLQAKDNERLEQLNDQVVEFDSAREHARLRTLKAEQERESRFRELERAKLIAISSRFPTHSETARYILAQLLTESTCLVCENVVPKVADQYAERIASGRCVVCNSDLSTTDEVVSGAAMADKRANRLRASLNDADADLSAARSGLDTAERDHQSHLMLIQQLRATISDRSRRVDHLIRELPPNEADLHEQRSELATLRARVEQMKVELLEKRALFRSLIQAVNRQLVSRSEDIRASFDQFAKGFLLEGCKLAWSPNKGRLGQTGEVFEFPGFEFDMTGADFPSPVRRTGPEQVSESQREFIDLAFRMALMAVAGQDGGGTLVIDAPESSLDAVFERRAADVLANFSEPSRRNRLIITSNLVEGNLIPRLVQVANKRLGSESGVVDLLRIATPTAAVRQLASEYQAVLRSILKRGGDI